MDNEAAFKEAYDKIYPLVETYFDEYFDEDMDEMPSYESMQEVARELQTRLMAEHPEVRQYLGEQSADSASVQYFGCGCFLWLILIGVAFGRCGGKGRCRRGCGYDRGCEKDCKDKKRCDDDFKKDKPFKFH